MTTIILNMSRGAASDGDQTQCDQGNGQNLFYHRRSPGLGASINDRYIVGL